MATPAPPRPPTQTVVVTAAAATPVVATATAKPKTKRRTTTTTAKPKAPLLMERRHSLIGVILFCNAKEITQLEQFMQTLMEAKTA